MHLYFAARAGKASLVSACKRMMKAAENAGFTCSLLSDGIVNDSADASVIIAVGGDGNLIRTAHVACREDLPLFGVNCGRIGFLTEWTEDRFPEALQKLAKGDFTIETRSMLTVSVNGERMRDCFNDLLVYKHSFSGVAKISLSLNGQEMGDLFGDGAVVATSTGATGYSLSAGGPILADGIDAMVITPICAHTLHFRPVVSSISSEIAIVMGDRGHRAADGDRVRAVSAGDRITVTRSDKVVRLMTFGTRNLFRLITEKLT